MFGGFISLALLFDDLFMFHERICPRYFGVGQKVVFLFYGSMILLYLVKFRKIIMETDFVFILLAIFFFALSMAVDSVSESLLPWHHLFEDGSKYLGIVSWLGYQFSVCFQQVQSFLTPEHVTEA
jgi:hypothetical protein